jgi:hypothetical protein
MGLPACSRTATHLISTESNRRTWSGQYPDGSGRSEGPIEVARKNKVVGLGRQWQYLLGKLDAPRHRVEHPAEEHSARRFVKGVRRRKPEDTS